ncbi:unnamed protein product [Chironomus riparius]|uniref:Uncharacterized protein n=1 Tax=Chironomus riparius TaxID=315576 RepID=A0A9N9WKP1_9DIPT|nr:unnamed protein product [Chironomus riparius]
MLPLVSTIPLSTSAFTALSIGGARCGSKTCEIYEFCSNFHNDCESCEPICDEQNNNFDRQSCINECQNYLHDRSYVKLSVYDAEIKNLKIYLTVTFVLVVILLILFMAFNGKKLFKICKNSIPSVKKPVKNVKPIEPMTIANPQTASPRMRIKAQNQQNNNHNLNRSSSIFTVTGTEYEAKTVSTPISTRYPAEDTLTSSPTADYSYDNRGLQLTPVTEKPKIETTF